MWSTCSYITRIFHSLTQSVRISIALLVYHYHKENTNPLPTVSGKPQDAQLFSHRKKLLLSTIIIIVPTNNYFLFLPVAPNWFSGWMGACNVGKLVLIS